MPLFYAVVIGVNISLIFKEDGGLENLYLVIEKHSKIAQIIAYFYVIFLGCFMFPIQFIFEGTYWFMLFIGYFYLGVIFYGLEKNKSFNVFKKVFLLNTIGLIGRIVLEWGENTMVKALTPMNIILYLIAVPFLIALVHITISITQKRFKKGR